MKRWVFVVVCLLWFAGCTYQSEALSSVSCEQDGQIEGDRQCRDGVWVQYTTSGDMRPDLIVDMVIDMPADTPDDLPDMQDMMPDIPDATGDMPDMNDMQDMSDMMLDMNDMPDMPMDKCGNGVLDQGESCDDGNLVANDGCDKTCQIEAGWLCPNVGAACSPECGDGMIVGNEQCDDGNTDKDDGCDDVCVTEGGWTCPANGGRCAPTCGDGQVVGNEQCDDNNTDDNDGCDAQCVPEQGWDCSAQTSCSPICGDGFLVVGKEQCDDDNTNDNDGCDTQCFIETGWTCPTNAAGACAPECGDGIIIGGEQCDDDNINNNDGCSSTCVIEQGYMCMGMPSSCMQNPVGNGQLDNGEECDDGNAVSGDGCDDQGQFEDGFICPMGPYVGQRCRLITGAGSFGSRDMTAFGGNSGNPFREVCPPDHFIVGVKGHIENDRLGRTTFICGRAEINSSGRLTWSQTVDLAQQGSRTDSFNQELCPSDKFAVGYKIWDQNGEVRGIELRCARFDVENNGLVRSSVRNISRHGENVGPNNTRTCLADEVAMGIFGLEGDHVDSLGFSCGIVRLHQCGDGRVDSSQACDDTNVANGDGCSEQCTVENNYTCTPQLFSSGSNQMNGILAPGAQDLVWQYSDSLMGARAAALVTDTCSGEWQPPFLDARWINKASCAQNSNGKVYFHAPFDLLPNFSADAIVYFALWADDTIDGLHINNISQGVSFGQSFRPQDVRYLSADGFQAGTNTITVEINNGGGAGGMFFFAPDPHFSKCM